MRKLSAIAALFFALSAFADTTVDPFSIGRNFSSLTVSGRTTDSGSITVAISNCTGSASFEKSVDIDTYGYFTAEFSSLTPGDDYAVSVGGTVVGRALLARDADQWIRENAATVAGTETGTGVWSGDGECKVESSRIVIRADTVDADQRVYFTPTNTAKTLRGYRLVSEMVFDGESDPPDCDGGIFGITLAVDPDDSARSIFAYIDGGEWHLTAVEGTAGEKYTVEFLIDETNRRIDYHLCDVTSQFKYFLGSGTIPTGRATRFKKLEFAGFGSLDGLDGKTFDDSLVSVSVAFDDAIEGGRIKAGVNYTNLNVTGWITVTNLWDTDITNGTVRIQVIGADGSTNAESTVEWSGTDDRIAFTNSLDGITAGGEYTVRVIAEPEETGYGEYVSVSEGGEYRSTMARRRDDVWYDETGDTATGLAESYGVWTSNEVGIVRTEGNGIGFVVNEDEEHGNVTFRPQAEIKDNVTATSSRIKAIFTDLYEVSSLYDLPESIAGLTVVNNEDDEAQLAVCGGNEWRLVPLSVYRPVMDTELEFEIYFNEIAGERGITYYTSGDDGRQIKLAYFALADDDDVRYDLVEFVGSGEITTLAADIYDTALLDLAIHFDVYGDELGEGRFKAGANYTNCNLTGWIDVKQLWDNDIPGGRVRFYVIGSDGSTNAVFTNYWDGVSERIVFTNMVDGLEAGAEYTVKVEADEFGDVSPEQVLGDTDLDYRGTMARLLDYIWFKEDGYTATGADPSYGLWWSGMELSVSEDGGIVMKEDEETEDGRAIFEPTNALPTTATATSSHFTTAFAEATEIDGLVSTDDCIAGITIVDGPEGRQFAVIDDGEWKIVSQSVFTPELGVEYSFEIFCNEIDEMHGVTYYVDAPGGGQIMLAYSELDVACSTRPESVEFHGSGEVDDFYGECYDLSLLDVDIEFDNELEGSGEWLIRAGSNYTNLTLVGRLTVTNLWEADISGGHIVFYVVGSDGATNSVFTNVWDGCSGTIAFTNVIDNLSPGKEYVIKAEVEADDGAKEEQIIGDREVDYRSILGRAQGEYWYDETGQTAVGYEESDGIWTSSGTIIGAGSDDSIVFNVDEDADFGEAVFTPTNALCQNLVAVSTRVRMSFPEACDWLSVQEQTPAVGGITLVEEGDSGLQLAVYADSEWHLIPRSVFSPELNVEYEFEIYSSDGEGARNIDYLLVNEDGTVLVLGGYSVGDEAKTLPSRLRFRGSGEVGMLRGELYDTSLLDIDIGLDVSDAFGRGEWRVRAGVNYTNLNLIGWISVTNLWENDFTGGDIRFYVIGSDGTTNSVFTNHWDGVSDIVAFTNVVNGLTPGGEYTVKAEIDDFEGTASEKQIIGDTDVDYRATMARLNGDIWFDEDAETATGAAPSYGIWSADEGVSIVGEGDSILIGRDEDATGSAYFLPTNGVCDNLSATSIRIRAEFAESCYEDDLPDCPDTVGAVMIADCADGQLRLALAVAGEWRLVSEDVFQPSLNEPIELELYGNEAEGDRGVTWYLIDGDHSITLLHVPVASEKRVKVENIEFSGAMRVDELIGECYDTSLLDLDIDLDGLEDGYRLIPGMNFTNMTLIGSFSVTNLWETDVRGGKVRFYVLNADGTTNTSFAVDWDGSSDKVAFTNVIDGLERGAEYHVVAVAEADNGATSEQIIGDNGDDYRGDMARDLLAVWFDENGLTAIGEEPSGGSWSVSRDELLITSEDGDIVFSAGAYAGVAEAVFEPTNPVVRNVSATSMRVRTVFTNCCDFSTLTAAATDVAGFTLVEGETSYKPCFAVIAGGVWVKIDRDVFAPAVDREYEFEVYVNESEDDPGVTYYLHLEDGSFVLLAHYVPGAGGDGIRPELVRFVGDGAVSRFTGDLYNTTLIDVELDFDDPVGGTNFTGVAIDGRFILTETWLTDMTNGTLRITVLDPDGNVVGTKDVAYHGSLDDIDLSFDGLKPGESYIINVQIITAEGIAEGDSDGTDILAPTAKEYDGAWIRENYDTFSKTVTGTGEWRYRTAPYAEARAAKDSPAGDAIQIDADLTSAVSFEATNDAPAVVNSTVREIVFDLYTQTPGYRLSAPVYATVRAADLAGVTVVCDDLGAEEVLRFSVYDRSGEGSWKVVPGVEAELNRHFTVAVTLTYSNPNKGSPASVAYYLVGEGGRRQTLAVFSQENGLPEIGERYHNRVRFTGAGYVSAMEGACYDAHLAKVEDTEYWTIEEAIEEIGMTGGVLEPLWYSRYVVALEEGYFGVLDEHVPPYLELVWPVGYVVEITTDGAVRYYLFGISDYWIDWADPDGVVATADGWKVLNANGLAYLARESTNSWLNGTITLDANIDNLAEHIWTPIRGFTGVFDGNGKTITGLTNKRDDLCWTNSLEMTAYGLFASASNSVFRNLAFAEVAISNSADAVGSLLGCSIGDLAMTNVIVRSGRLEGGGRFVSGIVGYIGDFDDVSLHSNLNAAEIIASGSASEVVSAAGIANLGKNAEGVNGALSVITNENRGVIVSTIDSADGGGNIAQILAGSDNSATYDDEAVFITGNIGTGDVSRVTSLNHPGSSFKALPVVNLAAEVSRQNEIEIYKEFIEANNSTDVIIDPYRLTARMTGSFYLNGITNAAGVINDMITASKPDTTLTVAEDYELWSPIIIDRKIVLDLNDKVLDTVFDDGTDGFYTFQITEDAGGALVQNGTVTYSKDKFANIAPAKDGAWWTNNVNTFSWNVDYWDRGLFVNGEFVDGLLAISMMLGPDSVIAVPEDSGFSIDEASGSLNYNGQRALSLSALGYSVHVEQDGEDTLYIVELDENPVVPPQISLSLEPGTGKSIIVVTGARSDCEYCLQSVSSLAENWDKTTDVWMSPAEDGESLEFTVDTSGSSGFFRISVRKK